MIGRLTKKWLATPALVTWVQNNCPELGNHIKGHISALTDLDAEGRETLWRCIMVSVRATYSDK